tara:strand:+ start:861 stop:1421 length:561 start_codon:yes stop_codon:yes gene_type:complete
MSITRHIKRDCKTLLGGVKTFYIMDWNKYSRSQILIKDQELTSYPLSTVFEVYSDTTNFSESSSFEGGATQWKQDFNFVIPKTEIGSELYKLLRKNVIIFYRDRINNLRVLGLFNGLEAQITNEAGQGKGDLNGYRVTLDGLEDNQSYFVGSLDDININIGDVYNYIFQNGDNFIFQDSKNFIFNT